MMVHSSSVSFDFLCKIALRNFGFANIVELCGSEQLFNDSGIQFAREKIHLQGTVGKSL